MLRPALFSPPMAVLLMAALSLTMLGGCNLPYTLMGFTTPDVRATFDGKPIDLAFRERSGGLVILNGKINGGSAYDFILDTGAPVSVVFDGPATRALQLVTSKARKLGPASACV